MSTTDGSDGRVRRPKRAWLVARSRHPAFGMGGSVLIAQFLTASIGVVAARALGPSGKGQVIAALAWSQIIFFVFLFGLTFAVSVRVAETQGEALPYVLGNAVLYATIVSVVVGGAAGVIAPLALRGLGSGAAPLVRWALVGGCLTMAGDLLAAAHIALGSNRRYSSYRLALPVLNSAIVLPFWLTGRLTAGWVIAGFVAGAAASFGIVSTGLPWRSMRIDLGYLRTDLRFGSKSYVASLLGVANLKLDILVMSLFLSATSVGLYGLANNAMVTLTAFPAAGGLLLLRSMAGTSSDNREVFNVQVSRIRRAARKYLLLAVGLGLMMFVAAPVLVPFILGASYRPSVRLIQILTPGYVARAYLALITAGLVGARRPWVGNVSEAVALVVTGVLLAVLLPHYAATGAAISSTVAYLTAAVVGHQALGRVERRMASERLAFSASTPLGKVPPHDAEMLP